MHPYLSAETAAHRQGQLLREAEEHRLLAAVRQPHPWRRAVGRRLISLGQSLAGESPRVRLA